METTVVELITEKDDIKFYFGHYDDAETVLISLFEAQRDSDKIVKLCIYTEREEDNAG